MSTQSAYSEKDLAPVSEREAREGYADWRQYDGQRIKSTDSPIIYLVINGVRHAIPDAFTYDNLFVSWSGVKVSNPLCSRIPPSTTLTNGAYLAQGVPSGTKYLVTNGVKRVIPDESTFENFYFNSNKVQSISDSILNSISWGEDIG